MQWVEVFSIYMLATKSLAVILTAPLMIRNLFVCECDENVYVVHSWTFLTDK
jgi:phage-related protein